MSSRRERRVVVLRGSADETRAQASALVAAVPPADVLWVGDGPGRARSVEPRALRSLLGQAVDVIVLDLHEGLDADVLGQCAGMIWGDGRLVLRMPPEGEPPRARLGELAVHPYEASDVTLRFWDRFERCLATSDARAPAAPIRAASHDVHGDEEQARVVDALARGLAADAPSLWALTADRGRGKSSALGLALRRITQVRALRVAVSAERPAGAAEIFRFAAGAPEPPEHGAIRYLAPRTLAHGGEALDVIVVDEAAQLPVPLLVQITERHPRARIAFSSTTRGYEGTGRGFVLRFLEWARAEGRPLAQLEMRQPIRWDEGDPLERFVDHALALDAEPAIVAAEDAASELVHTELDRDQLARDEPLLRDFFGLLVHAHYRTTPGDLHRMLDAPNLALHALLSAGRVVAASVVAREGDLPLELCERLARGRGRIRGHALPDTLISHAGRSEAGLLRTIRSVRIAVHPALRRRGLAARLVEHVHRAHPEAELFGTMFGATVDLLRFRRALGYELVRVGASRGSRTGEPAAVMVRPVSERARALVDALRADLARDLPLQLELLESDGEIALDAGLARALHERLPDAPPLDDEARRAIVARYLAGPQPFDAAARAITEHVERHRDALATLGPRERALIEGRVVLRRGWEQVARDAGYPSVPAAMRALRPALRALFERS